MDLEKLFSQPALSDCTGFLIGPNTLATAGHCVEDQESCQKNLWVFDYKLKSLDQVFTTFPEETVYECEKIVSKEHPILDYTLIQLKRSPNNRRPLKIRSPHHGKITGNPNLLVMGYPLGCPLKLSLQSF